MADQEHPIEANARMNAQPDRTDDYFRRGDSGVTVDGDTYIVLGDSGLDGDPSVTVRVLHGHGWARSYFTKPAKILPTGTMGFDLLPPTRRYRKGWVIGDI